LMKLDRPLMCLTNSMLTKCRLLPVKANFTSRSPISRAMSPVKLDQPTDVALTIIFTNAEIAEWGKNLASPPRFTNVMTMSRDC
jgi:hypothetical protein